MDSSESRRWRYAAALAKLKDYFGRAPLKDRTLDLWVDTFEEKFVEPDDLDVAVKQLGEIGKRFPTLAELLEAADSAARLAVSRSDQDKARADHERWKRESAPTNHPARLAALAAMKRMLAGPSRTRDDYMKDRFVLLLSRGEAAKTIERDMVAIWGPAGKRFCVEHADALRLKVWTDADDARLNGRKGATPVRSCECSECRVERGLSEYPEPSAERPSLLPEDADGLPF